MISATSSRAFSTMGGTFPKLGAHDNSAATVLADQVKRGLADIDPDGGDIGE